MIVSVVNQKGGAGKTTSAVNLAAAFAASGAQVGIIDLDRTQGCTSEFSVCLDEKCGVPVAFVESDLSELADLIRDFRDEGIEIVLLDCPPTLGEEIATALAISDVALVPIRNYSSLEGLARLMETIDAARRAGNLLLKYKLFLTFWKGHTNHSRLTLETATAAHGADLLSTRIPDSVAFEDAWAAKEPISIYASSSPGAVAYRELATEFLGLFPLKRRDS